MRYKNIFLLKLFFCKYKLYGFKILRKILNINLSIVYKHKENDIFPC
jgi:hypothetical protein